MFLFVFALGIASLPLTAQEAGVLGLEAYLAQVKAGNPDLAASRDLVEGLELAPLEAEVAFSPWLSGQWAQMDDKQLALVDNPATQMPALMETKTQSTSYAANLSKRWITGTSTQLSYGFGRRKSDLPQLAYEGDTWYQGTGSLSVSQSLLKDVFSRGTRAMIRAAVAKARSGQALARFGQKQMMLQAEATYVGLSMARESLRLNQESYARNQRLLGWLQGRANLNLTQEADLLATEAATRQAELNVAQARITLASAERGFNALRGQDTGQVPESLQPLGMPKGSLGAYQGRGDVKAAAHDQESLDAQAIEVADRYTPDLQAFGVFTYNGLGLSGGKVQDDSLAPNYQTTLLGLRLNMTLDIPLWYRVSKGAGLARNAAQQTLDARKLQARREWAGIETEWSSLRERLALAEKVESLLKRRSELEKERYKKGRTSNYMVLQAEEQYSQARLGALALRGQALTLQAQARLYTED
jgi:outer membrane protein TolC